MNSQRSERCRSCHRVKGDPLSAKRPPRYCWLEHDDACRAAELWSLRNVAAVVEVARKLVSTPRGTAAHRAAELELVRTIAKLDTQPPPTAPLEPAPA
jgi:hypothetical protein